MHCTLFERFHGPKNLQFVVVSLFSSFPKPKDPVSKDEARNVTCSIPCEDHYKHYIRETKQKFDILLTENTKKQWKTKIYLEIHTLNIVFNLVKLFHENRLQ